ncbi:MAG: AraC family transcriptional regulator [Pseudomonadota bacterium]
MTQVIDNTHTSQPDLRVPSLPNETDLGNVRVILLPPGECNVQLSLATNMIDISLPRLEHEIAVNTDRMTLKSLDPETIAFYPSGTDFRVLVENPLPGCVLEITDQTLTGWMDAGEVPEAHRNRVIEYRRDPVAADLGRGAIRHLMRSSSSSEPTDALTVEALALGIAARGMAQIGALDGDTSAEMDRWARRGKRANIDRSVDLLEERLRDADLKICDLAQAAGMSSSHFSHVFKSMLGETPYNFILRRRAEFARDLIIGTRTPLSQVAFEAGFSSQAHMSVVIRRVFGTTPGAMRD